MDLLKKDIKNIPNLIVGFIIMSFGIILIKRSDLGLFAWGVLHDGLDNVTPLSFGQVTIVVGLVVLVFSVLLFKTNVGIGTLLNLGIVGLIIDLFDQYFRIFPETIFLQVVFFVIGLVLMTFGRAMYISTKLGAGPRDGLFVGLSHVTQIKVKYIKPVIEIIVLVIGALLGGVFGIGTLIIMISSAYLVQTFLQFFGYDPRKEKQHNIIFYLNKTKAL
jgi:uncharacterized membrane protein YczE